MTVRDSALLVSMVTLLATSCVVMTHAEDYEIREPRQDDRLCVQCSSRPDLLHPPCPPDGQTAMGDQTLYFALQSLDLGTHAASWGAGYAVGLDQDCSDRPGGRPVDCEPRSPLTLFERLGGGVDNALATQILYPLIQSDDVHPEVILNHALEVGEGGVLLAIDGWNGLSDDERVGVRLLPLQKLAGVEGRAPAWDGSDRWIAYADRMDPEFPGRNMPDTSTKTQDAYVAGGVLVWDARSVPAFLLPIGAGGAVLDIHLSNAVLTARLRAGRSPRVLENAALAGVWSAFLASRNVERLADLIALCDPDEAARILPHLEGLIAEAPDMLLPTSQDATSCDAISVGVLGTWVEVESIEGIVPMSEIPQSCGGSR